MHILIRMTTELSQYAFSISVFLMRTFVSMQSLYIKSAGKFLPSDKEAVIVHKLTTKVPFGYIYFAEIFI